MSQLDQYTPQQAAAAANAAAVGVASGGVGGRLLAFPQLSAAPAMVSSESSACNASVASSHSSHSSPVSGVMVSAHQVQQAPVAAGVVARQQAVAAVPTVMAQQYQPQQPAVVQQHQQEVVQTTPQAITSSVAAASTANHLLQFAPHLATAAPINSVVQQQQPSNPFILTSSTTATAIAALLPGGSVPEFLYQLTKMLTDNCNREIIEWSTYSGNGRIEVHHPARLEREVLGRYFRHSKYSSFQRQLNYFGFRKIAGKGKMSPCSYINEAATVDIRSLLLMKRKNSKEKQAEKESILQQQLAQAQLLQQQQQALNTTGANVVAGMVSAAACPLQPATKKQRTNPGDDIQPATVRPMFTMSSASTAVPPVASATGNHEVFNAMAANISRAPPVRVTTSTGNNDTFNTMAANISRNIATGNIHPASAAVQQTSQEVLASRISPVLEQSTSSVQPPPVTSPSISTAPSSATETRGYTVAVGKGVRHQLNGYLRMANTAATLVPVAPVASSPASTLTASTTTSTNTNYASNLSHPPAKQVSSTSAPLQFLDPSELGMSVENSLSQLKNNFAAATNIESSLDANAGLMASSSVETSSAAVTDSSALSDHASSSTLSSSINGNAGNDSRSNAQFQNVKYAPSALTRRVTSMSFLGGMLSRDDSLINLAMLPTLDPDKTNNSTASTTTSGATPNSIGSSSQDYMAGLFSRDDSLMNLAKIVDTATSSTYNPVSSSSGAAPPEAAGATAAKVQQLHQHAGASGGDVSNDVFGFIDFPS